MLKKSYRLLARYNNILNDIKIGLKAIAASRLDSAKELKEEGCYEAAKNFSKNADKYIRFANKIEKAKYKYPWNKD